MGFSISYGGYAFDQAGVVQYGASLAAGPGTIPRRVTETYRVHLRFFETSFADNEQRWLALRTYIEANPRAILHIEDERGTVLRNQQVKFDGIEGAAEWGEFRREVTLTFSAIGGVLTLSSQTARFTPTGGAVVFLPNVDAWTAGKRTERYSSRSTIRREANFTIVASGKFTVDQSLTPEQKRDALLAVQASILSASSSGDGLLSFGAFSATVQMESLTCDLGDTQDELSWSLSAFRLDFPEDEYSEADYTVTADDAEEDNIETITVAGKILSESKAHAHTSALAIKALYAEGRQFLNQSLADRVVSSADGQDDCLELSFSFRFRGILGTATSWSLSVDTAYDARAGDITTTYSGKVTAGDASTALAKARSLGANKDSGTGLIFLNSTEKVTSSQIQSGPVIISIEVSFSYSYVGKSPIVFAEVSFDTSTEFFGANSYTISGSCTAATEAAALTFARGYQIAGALQRSLKETPGHRVRSTSPSGDLLTQVTFAYVYEKACVRVTANYGRDAVNDYTARTTTVTFSGTVYGPTLAACNALADTICRAPEADARQLTSERKDTHDYVEAGSIDVLVSLTFTSTWVMPLADPSGIKILSADFSISYRYSISVAQIDEIPFGVPYVQANVTQSPGSITVSGNVVTTADGLSTGQAWARALKSYGAGYLKSAEETPKFDYLPLNSTAVKTVSFGFSYAWDVPTLSIP